MFATKPRLTEEAFDHILADAFMQGNSPSPEFAQLLRDALRSGERDRRLMALDIHDGLLQYVIGALYQLEMGPWALEDASQGEAPPSEEMAESQRGQTTQGSAEPVLGQYTAADFQQLNNARALLRKAIAEGRRLIGGLRPPVLEDRGLLVALQDLVDERNALSARVIEFKGESSVTRYSALTEGMLFRIAQEGLTNACQHSKATQIVVRLADDGEYLHLQVHDNGTGFDPQNVRDSASGLSGIRERVRWMGGICEIDTAPDLGTLLKIQLPISLTSLRMRAK